MSAFDMTIEQEALDWLIRVNDSAFHDWDAWDRWMAADPRHAASYWRLAEAEAEMVETLRSRPRAAAAVVSIGRTSVPPRRAFFAAAAAAVAVVLGGVWLAWSEMSGPLMFETAPGETRSLTLGDGSRVSLAGASRVAVNRRDPRDVSLQEGRALFEVIHDDSDPFIVMVGDTRLTDLGTTFDVTRLQDGLRVSVSEGRVLVEAEGGSATLDPGDSVLVGPLGLDRRTVPVEDVAGWRTGRLSYANETLSIVAEDLERAIGIPISVAPSAAQRRFTGSLGVHGEAAALKPRLSALLGVLIVDVDEGWRLEPR